MMRNIKITKLNFVWDCENNKILFTFTQTVLSKIKPQTQCCNILEYQGYIFPRVLKVLTFCNETGSDATEEIKLKFSFYTSLKS